MEVRREDIDTFLAVMERSARAQERLIELATEERNVEFTPTPPFCPHCQALNPEVSNEGGAGAMDTFILVARHVGPGGCGGVIYGVPEGWQVYGSPEAAREAIEGGGNERHA